jgi:hypothetical protein
MRRSTDLAPLSNIPTHNKAATEYLSLFHTSFHKFIRDPSRSWVFTISPQFVCSNFVEVCFRILGKMKLLGGSHSQTCQILFLLPVISSAMLQLMFGGHVWTLETLGTCPSLIWSVSSFLRNYGTLDPHHSTSRVCLLAL